MRTEAGFPGRNALQCPGCSADEAGQADSLNVAVTAAVLLFEAVRQRRG